MKKFQEYLNARKELEDSRPVFWRDEDKRFGGLTINKIAERTRLVLFKSVNPDDVDQIICEYDEIGDLIKWLQSVKD